MKLVVFGLTVSSSWGNGHATLWRGLIRALAALGHRVVFFEHDVPYYAGNRDLSQIPNGALVLYGSWNDVRPVARRELADADVAIVTSFCPHGVDATELIGESARPKAVFYDLDTPVTLSLIEGGAGSTAIGPRGLRDFDLVLSYTGGVALDALRQRLGAASVAPLYGHVDPDAHRPDEPAPEFAADLSYLGTYAQDRQQALDALLIEPARQRPHQRFLIAGAQYPADFPWTNNIYFVRHLPPSQHSSFYASSRLTLNVTRQAMAEMGWCPSGRLFEAASCGATLVSDAWEGLDAFFEPDREILIARTAEDVLQAMDRSPDDLRAIGRRARERVLAQHTSAHRVKTLLEALDGVQPRSRAALAMGT